LPAIQAGWLGQAVGDELLGGLKPGSNIILRVVVSGERWAVPSMLTCSRRVYTNFSRDIPR